MITNKYIDAEKLIAEIERRRKQRIEANNKIAKGEIFTDTEDEFNNSLARYGNRLVYQELFEIICFIESLQQEHPEVDLEKELEQWLDLSGIGEAWENGEWSTNDIKRTAYHFYELGFNTRNEK